MTHKAQPRFKEKKMPYERPFTVFLVDDDADDLVLAARVLESSPQIKEVVRIADANQLFRELQIRHSPLNGPDRLILLDIHMPGLNGIELLDQLKSSPHTRNIPVVMLTSDHRTDNIEKTYNMEADSFIVKPLSEVHLERLQAIIDKGNDRKQMF